MPGIGLTLDPLLIGYNLNMLRPAALPASLAILLIAHASTASAMDVMRQRLGASVAFVETTAGEQPSISFLQQPVGFSAVAGRQASTPFTLDHAGVPGVELVIVPQSEASWLAIDGDRILAFPDAGMTLGTYGPFAIEAQAPGAPALSSNTFSVTVEAISAANTMPSAAYLSNAHLAVPEHGGSTHGFQDGSPALLDALFDGLDDPVITFDWLALNELVLHYPTGIDGNSCVVKVVPHGGSTIPTSMGIRIGVIDMENVFTTMDVTPVFSGGNAYYAGACTNALGPIQFVTTMVTGMDDIARSMVEFKFGKDGIYPR